MMIEKLRQYLRKKWEAFCDSICFDDTAGTFTDDYERLRGDWNRVVPPQNRSDENFEVRGQGPTLADNVLPPEMREGKW